MSRSRAVAGVMERVTAYRLWQAPFAEKKLAPLRRHNDLSSIGRVLDVGCGPGTNARHFASADYLGVDINPAYVEYARRIYGNRFEVADVTQDAALGASRFDFILMNSLLHHLETQDVRRLLSRLNSLLADGGHVHILDLVLPETSGLPRTLARWDRGDHPRPLEEWRALFTEGFQPVLFEPYPLRAFGVTLWSMVYFKGRRRA
jgi:SAM-dependent methyltransferase